MCIVNTILFNSKEERSNSTVFRLSSQVVELIDNGKYEAKNRLKELRARDGLKPNRACKASRYIEADY